MRIRKFIKSEYLYGLLIVIKSYDSLQLIILLRRTSKYGWYNVFGYTGLLKIMPVRKPTAGYRLSWYGTYVMHFTELWQR
jgi:hypothetical protein